MKKIIYLLLLILSLTFVVGCNKEDNEQNNEPNNPSEDVKEDLIDVSMVVFENDIVNYDGKTHSINVSNLPEGVNPYYSGNDISDIGTHTVTVVLKDKEKNVLATLTATLTIRIDISNVIFEDDSFNMDGNTHEIKVKNLPYGVEAKYEGNKVSEEGEHTVTAKLYDYKGNLLSTLTAKIIIVSNPDVELPLV